MRVRRVVVALEPVPCSAALLEAAVEVAGRLEAELVGLFVENVELLHLAGLPFAHEVGCSSATRRPLDVAAMERALRAAADEAQRRVAAAAARAPVRWSFRVTRGAFAAELMAAAETQDLVVAGRARPTALPGVRVVQAGAPDELTAALREPVAGAVVLAGDEALIGHALRRLIAEQGSER